MKYCEQCGTAVSVTANYCQNCGKRLNGISAGYTSITGFSLNIDQPDEERHINCDVSGSDVIVVETSKDEEIRLICPYASRFDGFGWYRIDCKLKETFFSRKQCGIFEGMRKFK